MTKEPKKVTKTQNNLIGICNQAIVTAMMQTRLLVPILGNLLNDLSPEAQSKIMGILIKELNEQNEFFNVFFNRVSREGKKDAPMDNPDRADDSINLH